MRRSYGHHRVKENFNQLYEKIVQLKLPASDGKKYNTDCANTETLFRIIQSIPSPKAEPFKRWLATVGYERVQENKFTSNFCSFSAMVNRVFFSDPVVVFGKSITIIP